MDFSNCAFKDVVKYELFPTLDPITKLVLDYSINYHQTQITKIKLTYEQLISLGKYPALIDYFSSNKCDIKKGFLSPRSWGLHGCGWYPYKYKAREYRKYTPDEYEANFSHYSSVECRCVNCSNPGYCTINDLRPFLDGIINKPITKQVRRFRSRYGNILYACGMIASGLDHNLNKPPFHSLLHDKITPYLMYFAILSKSNNMISKLYNNSGVHEIDHALRWLPDKHFMWIVENYDSILEQSPYMLIEWVLGVLSRDRLSGYYK